MEQHIIDLGEFDPNVDFYHVVNRLKEEGTHIVSVLPLRNTIIVSATKEMRRRIEEITEQAKGNAGV